LRRIDFLKALGLFGLTSCIEEEIMNKKKLYDWWSGDSAFPSPVQIGEIYSTDFTTLDGWTDTSTNATFTPSVSGLSVSGGIGTTYVDDFITYDFPNSIENFTVVCEFVMNTAGNFTIGIDSIQKVDTGGGNGLNRSFFGRCVVSAGNYIAVVSSITEGKYSVAQNDNISTGLPISNGDSMRITWTRSDFNLYTCVVENLTKGTSRTASARQTYAAPSVPNVAGNFSIHAFSGTQTVTYFSISSTSYKNVRGLFVGDSITHVHLVAGVTQGSLRYAARTFSGSAKRYEVQAGGNHRITHILQCIEALKLMNPQYLIMMIGGNDQLDATPPATYQAQYQSLRDQMKTNGSSIIHLLATPRDATNMTTWNNWITSTFTTDLVIDTFTPLKGVGTDLAAAYDNGDGVHPNQAGQQLIADTIVAAIPTLV